MCCQGTWSLSFVAQISPPEIWIFLNLYIHAGMGTGALASFREASTLLNTVLFLSSPLLRLPQNFEIKYVFNSHTQKNR